MNKSLRTPSSPATRLEALRRILKQGSAFIQEDVRNRLARLSFDVTQSTVSRDLRRLGAIRTVAPDGRIMYRLPEVAETPVSASLADMILDVQCNKSMVVVRTTVGSASLIARQLDRNRPNGMLGTIAGDDTVFVALADSVDPKSVAKTIRESVS